MKVAFVTLFVLVLLTFILVSVFISAQSYDEGLLIETKVGLIRGLRARSGNYAMFMGIPYAYVDYDNPFGNALPYPEFEGIFEAYDDSVVCPQIEEFNHTITGGLDCLNIHINVPNSASDTNRLPVLLWIYGGRFVLGFGGRYLYGPEYFMKHDVILVTFNYRLGPYGFMCLDIPEVPGNQGLKDQQIAIRWIKNNIEAFGGDPDRITLLGNSAGGTAADLHLLHKEQPMFKSAVMQSGTSLLISSSDTQPNVPMVLAKHLGYITNDVYDALSFIAKINPHELIKASNDIGITYGVCFEKSFDNVENFLTDHPLNLDVPNAKDMPIMIGVTSDEYLFIYRQKNNTQYLSSLFTDIIENKFNLKDDELIEMVKIARQFYIGDKEINSAVIREIIEFGSDTFMNYDTERAIKKLLDNGAKVYYYIFSYDGGRNFVKHRENFQFDGVQHADELGYLFDISYMDKPSPADQIVIDKFTEMWANFAKYGDPTPATTELLPVKWEPIRNNSAFHYLDIDLEVKAGMKPRHQRMAFWDLFYKINTGN